MTVKRRVVKGQRRIDRDDSDVEIAALARPPRRARAEEHGEPKRRPVGKGLKESIVAVS